MSNALITLAIGCQPYFFITLPLMKQYARYIGVDFICIDQPSGLSKRSRNFSYEKKQIETYLSRYERILYVDADILIRKKENIFDICSDLKKIILVQDVYNYFSHPITRISLQAMEREFGSLPLPYEKIIYYNAGMYLLSYHHKQIYNDNYFNWHIRYFANKKHFFNDQDILNFAIAKNNLSVFLADRKWNYILSHPDNNISKAIFLHFAGLESGDGKKRHQLMYSYI